MAAEGEAGTEVGTLGVSVEISVRVGCAVVRDTSIFVVSDVAVSLVVVGGAGVECGVVGGTGPGVGPVMEVRLAAEVVGCLVDASVADVVRVVDGVPVVAVLVDGVTISSVMFAVTGTSEGLRVVGIPGVDVAAETLDVTDVVVGDVAPADDTCWGVGRPMRAVVTGASGETVVWGGDGEGDAGVVGSVKVSTLPDTGCVVSVTGSTATGLKVVEAEGGLGDTVVAVVSATLNTGGGVTNFLVVVAGISAVETSAGDVLVVAAVTPVVTGADVTGRRGAPVVEVTLDDNSGVVTAVGVWTEVEVVCTREGSEV